MPGYNILVTGARGQLGQEITRISGRFQEHKFYFTDVDELDITKIVLIERFLEENEIHLIVNCAAYNYVDGAEKEVETAFMINALAVKYLAQLAQRKGIFFIHISSDYVFDGMNNVPYLESDQPNPLSAYARSKHQGEINISSTLERAVILRTSWLYSVYGKNFLKTILNYAREKKQLNVVCDQVGTPTYAADLAQAIMGIIHQHEKISEIEIFHYSNEGIASWYDFAKAIIDIAGMDCFVKPVNTKDYALPAHRPFYSVLDKSKIRAFLNTDIPYWRDSLKNCLKEMKI